MNQGKKNCFVQSTHWKRVETEEQAWEAGSQEICQCMVRSWSLGHPPRKIIQGVEKKKVWANLNKF